MDKRTFLKTLGTVAAASLTNQTWGDELPGDTNRDPTTDSPRQKNWVWMRTGRRSDDEWRRLFEQLKSVGIDAVLPEVYNGYHAHFNHPHPSIESRSRVLEQMIPLAHAAGVEVHAWMWTMPCGNKAIMAAHPDWYAVNGLGESAHEKPAYVDYYKFLCPRKEEVREFIEGNVAALAQIEGLDGVHLDYVRLPDVILAKGLWKKYDIVQDREYPPYDYCYCDDCRQQFARQTGIDPLQDLEDPAADDAWRQFRCDGVTSLVNDRLAPRARAGGKQVTAAVFPNWWNVRQEWHRWQLDAFLPMLYHSFYEESIDWIGAQVSAARDRMEHPKPIYAGLFLPALSLDELTTAINSARGHGAAGIALFSHGALREKHWALLGQQLPA